MCRGLLVAVFATATLIIAADAQEGPKGAVVLIIRHGEKPESGPNLSPRGQERAEAYVHYFQELTVDSERLVPDAIFAAKDTKGSSRPRQTVEPFAKAEKLRVDAHFSSTHSAQLAASLRTTEQGKRILISWHHTDIPNLLRAVGANPKSLLPRGKWPDSVFDWVLLLRYDQDGRLIPGSERRINEHLLPGDSP